MIQIPEVDLRQAIATMQYAKQFCTNQAAKARLKIQIGTLTDYLPETLEAAIWDNMYAESKIDQDLNQP